jgi:predicted amidophosphoribosyltransferase
MLQEREAELAEVERLLHMQEGSIAGACASCGAVRSRGAVFCWQCGAQVMARTVAPTPHRETAKPVVAPAVSREMDVTSRAITQRDELGIGRPVPIP